VKGSDTIESSELIFTTHFDYRRTRDPGINVKEEVNEMEQNEPFFPNEPVTEHVYTSTTHVDNQSTQPVINNTQPAMQNVQTETHSAQAEAHPAKRIVGVIFSAIEIVLLLRFFLKLLGANAENIFMKILYGFTGIFVMIFEGIFSRVTIDETSGAVFEPATLIAMIVIALIAWGVLKLMTRYTGRNVVKTQYSGPT
jgi:hypothetical protein